MDMTIRSIKHPLRPDSDIDPTGHYDVKEVDAFVYGCTSAAQDALSAAVPPGFGDFERDQLKELIEGQRHSHGAIRKLLQGEQAATAVGALTIARVQLETLYSFCYMLQELGVPAEPGFAPARIRKFPSPMRIISVINTPSQKKVLQRLYPEYQYLCSFAHPDPESSLFRARQKNSWVDSGSGSLPSE